MIDDESNHRAALPAATVEQHSRHGSMAKKEMPRFDSPVRIRVISYRKRTHDPDGVSSKAVIDGLVQRGLLKDDSTEQVKSVTFESIKTKGEEKTVIEISDEN